MSRPISIHEAIDGGASSEKGQSAKTPSSRRCSINARSSSPSNSNATMKAVVAFTAGTEDATKAGWNTD